MNMYMQTNASTVYSKLFETGSPHYCTQDYLAQERLGTLLSHCSVYMCRHALPCQPYLVLEIQTPVVKFALYLVSHLPRL